MIKLRNISKVIKGKRVLEDISLKFEKGKVYLIKGHNGSGKTMLLRMICKLISPSEGDLYSEPVQYGVVIESPSFIENETARFNLKFLASIQRKIGMNQIEDSLKQLNLLSDADTRVSKFSLGMKQRLAICQAIMEDPEVLLLDEPFNALDELNFRVVVDYLNEIKKDKIIIVVAHGFDTEKITLFDEIITMENGRILK